jgi:hypothetical protein
MPLMSYFLQPNDERTILHYLARVNHPTVLAAVLESKKCQFTFDSGGESPFHLAVLSKNGGFLDGALKAGCYEQLFVKNSADQNPVTVAESLHDTAFLGFLTSAVSDAVTVMAPRLYEGGRQGDLYLVASALSCGISSDELDSSGRSVLSYACEYGHTEVAAWGPLTRVLTKAKCGESPEFWNPTNQGIIICGIVLGMEYIHSIGHIHRGIGRPRPGERREPDRDIWT